MSGSFSAIRLRPAATATRLVYEGADIDQYRAAFGKTEGERRFFLEHRPAAQAVADDPSASASEPDDGPEFDPLTPFDSVFVDTSDPYFDHSTFDYRDLLP